jgi:hypothetical protein
MDIIFKDPTCKNIAIRLSGGPDSAIIYYAICDFYKNQNDVNIFPYTMSSPLRPHAIKNAKAVIEFTTAATGKAPAAHYTVHHTAHNKDNSQEVNDFEYVNGQELLQQTMMAEQSINIIYTGVSMNCPTKQLEDFATSLTNVRSVKYQDVIQSRDSSRDDTFLPRLTFVRPYYSFLPLVNVDKHTVKQLFDHYGITETLFPITWSCEDHSQADAIDPEHCGACYFCLEREFVFGRL